MPGLTAVVDHPVVQVIARALVLATYAWAGLAMMAGQDLLTNPIFGFVFVWMWVGLVPISLLLGQFWRATNPLADDPSRAVRRGSSRPGTGPADACQPASASGPRRSACSDSAGSSWCSRTEPRWRCCDCGRWLWLVTLVLGAIIFGQRWIGAADPFEAYASTRRSDVDLPPGR